MKVGTPVVREALICLQGQGFVRRVTNTGTFVTKFSAEEVRQLYTLRVELEALALEWARPRVSASDLAELKALVDDLVKSGEAGARREFLECDFIFHKRCWELSGNTYLADTLRTTHGPAFCVRCAGQQRADDGADGAGTLCFSGCAREPSTSGVRQGSPEDAGCILPALDLFDVVH